LLVWAVASAGVLLSRPVTVAPERGPLTTLTGHASGRLRRLGGQGGRLRMAPSGWPAAGGRLRMARYA